METNKYQMRRGLSKTDKKLLRDQCKTGIGLCILVFVFNTILGVTVYELFFDLNPEALNTKMMILISIGTLIFSVTLNILVNYKYYRDFQFNEKIQEIKTLTSKSKTTEYVASLPGASLSKASIVRFEFLVEDIKFDVDNELFERCTDGDKLIFSYALKSQYLLSIEKAG